MKRKSNQTTLKAAIERYLEAFKLDSKMDQMDVKSSWENVMGTPIARRTKDLYFKDKTLFVLLDSSVLREELMMGKTRIIQLLNEHAGKAVVEDIVFK